MQDSGDYGLGDVFHKDLYEEVRELQVFDLVGAHPGGLEEGDRQ
jgi:hypothetical protein